MQSNQDNPEEQLYLPVVQTAIRRAVWRGLSKLPGNHVLTVHLIARQVPGLRHALLLVVQKPE